MYNMARLVLRRQRRGWQWLVLDDEAVIASGVAATWAAAQRAGKTAKDAYGDRLRRADLRAGNVTTLSAGHPHWRTGRVVRDLSLR